MSVVLIVVVRYTILDVSVSIPALATGERYLHLARETYEGAGVTVVMRKAEQSAMPDLVGNADALRASIRACLVSMAS